VREEGENIGWFIVWKGPQGNEGTTTDHRSTDRARALDDFADEFKNFTIKEMEEF
jgi:hypothetical protein